MRESVFISDFVNIKPPVVIQQEEALIWLIDRHMAHASAEERRTLEKFFRHYGVKKEKIAQRYFAHGEMQKKFDEELTIYRKDNALDIEFKSKFFSHYAIDVFNKIYHRRPSLPDHLIHVTCTGYVSPSAPQVVVSQLEGATRVTHAYHMGCYAAMPAIRAACGLITSGESKKIDVVHTEACSLHMDPSSHTPEQMVIQTLFADGNIKYSLGSMKPRKASFEMVAQKELILPNTEQDMRWELKRWGFAMTLARSVPEKIALALPNFLQALADAIKIPREQLQRQALFAIHPGGPKIIESVASLFDLNLEQIRFCKKVLFERGNMSSATLPHVWEEIINSDAEDGKIIVSLAFGPGLSIFGAIFKFLRGDE
jgi:predicted naringenin-chalcone synthase